MQPQNPQEPNQNQQPEQPQNQYVDSNNTNVQPQVSSSSPTTSSVPVQPTTNENNLAAVLGLIFSIIGLGLIGVILGIIGLKKSKELNGKGHGLALAAIIVGIISMFISLVVFLMILLAVPSLQKNAKLQQQKIQQQNQQYQNQGSFPQSTAP
jgi:beta-lactamase regulating signal transducer with metallopeptidase domain